MEAGHAGTAVRIRPMSTDGVVDARAGARNRIALTVAGARVLSPSRALSRAVRAYITRETRASHCGEIADTVPEAHIGGTSRAAATAVGKPIAHHARADTGRGALTKIGAGGRDTTGADPRAIRAPIAIEATALARSLAALRAHTSARAHDTSVSIGARAGILTILTVLPGVTELGALSAREITGITAGLIRAVKANPFETFSLRIARHGRVAAADGASDRAVARPE